MLVVHASSSVSIFKVIDATKISLVALGSEETAITVLTRLKGAAKFFKG